MNPALITSLRSTITRECLKHGVNDAASIKQILQEASKGIKHMQIAGIKAALTKGQTVGV